MAAALQDAKLTALFDARLDAAITGLRPAQAAVTWRLKPQPGIAAEGAEQVYRIECFWDDGTKAAAARVPTFSLAVPEGWRVAEAPVTRTEAAFTVRGTPERLLTPLTILAKAGDEVIRQTVQIPAPWRVVCGPGNGGAWNAGRIYQPDNGVPFM